jgi:membrane protein involved in colicin uptake
MRREDAENRRSEERRRRKQDQAVAAKKKNKKKRKKEGRKLTPEEIERKKKLQAEKLARRKARREKAARIFKIVLKILLILVVLCAIAFVYIRTCYKLKSIKVTGTDHYTDQQMVDIVTGGKDYGNTLLFILESRLNPAQDVTFIDKIDVTYVNRNSVEITVYEKAMAGCIKYNDQYAYFDGDGIVLEISDAKLDDVPCIEGLTSDSVEQGKKLDVGDSGFFQEILTMTQLIYKSGIQIDKITYDTDQNLILHKDRIKIRIGDGENLETKFMNLESILESVKGKKGTLDMSNYSESQRNVIFKENK